MKKERKIVIFTIIITLLLDQITKIIALKMGKNIQNNAIPNNTSYIIITIFAIIMLFKYIFNDNQFIKTDTKIILSLAISGAIGNLIDKIWNHNVILFINLGNNIKLNLAYIYIFIAWIGMAFILTKNTKKFINSKKEMKNENSSKWANEGEKIR